MTWVKVCGLTRRSDVLAAVDAGADAVGFVLIESSPRAVTAEEAAALAADVPVETVVLTAADDVTHALALVETVGASGIQPYGPAAGDVAAAASAAGLLVLYPVPVSGPISVSPAPPGAIPLFDTSDPGLGGSGRTFDWEHVRPVGERYVLAGGLGPENVAAAVLTTGAWGVDASSGLEAAPGVKDPGKVAAFITRAKRAVDPR